MNKTNNRDRATVICMIISLVTSLECAKYKDQIGSFQFNLVKE